MKNETFMETSLSDENSVDDRKETMPNLISNIHKPWIYVEPTSTEAVKAPNKNEFKVENIEDLNFLRKTKIPLTDDDLDIILNAFKKENHNALYKTPTVGQQNQVNSFRLQHINSKSFSDDELDVISARNRGENDVLDDLFKPNEEIEDVMQFPHNYKDIIIDSINELPSQKTSISSTRENKASSKLPGGRKKIIDAIDKSTSFAREEDSLTYASRKLEAETALKRAALANCFGAQSFKQYLEQQNAAIPPELKNINRKTLPKTQKK